MVQDLSTVVFILKKVKRKIKPGILLPHLSIRAHFILMDNTIVSHMI